MVIVIGVVIIVLLYYYYIHAKYLNTTTSHIRQLINADPFFTGLSAKNKKIFVQRVVHFVQSRNFYGKEDFQVEPQHQVSIALNFVKVFFWFEPHLASTFDTFFIYPEPFYVDHFKSELKGGVSPEGQVMLAWTSHQEGDENTHDGINLGIHEAAHALQIAIREGLAGEVVRLRLEMLYENIRIWKETKPDMFDSFRTQARANEIEIFAACTELYFENPARLQDISMELFTALANIITNNQQ